MTAAQTEMQYAHKGVTITFHPDRAVFRASIPGKNLSGPSLAAIRKQIDDAQKFTPFSALVESHRHSTDKSKVVAEPVSNRYYKLVRCMIVGLNKENRHGQRFIDDTGGSHYFVLPDTTEAVAAWKAHEAAEAEKTDAVAALDKKISDLHGKIGHIRASDYGQK